MNKIHIPFYFLVTLFTGCSFYWISKLNSQNEDLKSQISKINISSPNAVAPQEVISEVNKKNWSVLQATLKDTVVQVFAAIAEFNLLEPYKTPSQNEVSGSGFFIDDLGHIITNAHVVEQAKLVGIQIPSTGKRRFYVDIIGISPERRLVL